MRKKIKKAFAPFFAKRALGSLKVTRIEYMTIWIKTYNSIHESHKAPESVDLVIEYV